MKNSLKATHDIHIVRYSYKASYLKQFVNNRGGPKPRCQVCDLPFSNSEQCIDHLFQYHSDLIEGLYPSFIGS